VNKKPKAPSAESQTHTALLGDLESIRSLLDSPKSTPPPDDGSDVPVLEDMVEGALTVNESNLASRASFDDGASAKRSDSATAKRRDGAIAERSDGAGKTGLADATIKVLLGDEWRNEARKIIADARSNAEGAGTQWTAAQLNSLNETLKVRIDRTLDDWLVEMLNSRVDDLRSKLLAVLENELDLFTRALTDDTDSHGQ
jgi:hypothetical protein